MFCTVYSKNCEARWSLITGERNQRGSWARRIRQGVMYLNNANCDSAPTQLNRCFGFWVVCLRLACFGSCRPFYTIRPERDAFRDALQSELSRTVFYYLLGLRKQILEPTNDTFAIGLLPRVIDILALRLNGSPLFVGR